MWCRKYNIVIRESIQFYTRIKAVKKKKMCIVIEAESPERTLADRRICLLVYGFFSSDSEEGFKKIKYRPDDDDYGSLREWKTIEKKYRERVYIKFRTHIILSRSFGLSRSPSHIILFQTYYTRAQQSSLR